MRIEADWYKDYSVFHAAASHSGRGGRIELGIFADMSTMVCVWQVRAKDNVVLETVSHNDAIAIYNALVEKSA